MFPSFHKILLFFLVTKVSCFTSDSTDETLSANFWRDLSISLILILIAGITSGLTAGYSSLDLTHLKALKKSRKEGYKYAESIVPILKRNHLMLVTLLLAFSASLEALPIFLAKLVPDPYITLAISIPVVLFFVQLIPSSVCRRWALPIGFYLSWFVWGLMGLFFIVAWPISKILDIIFGKKKTNVPYENFKDMVESYMTDDQEHIIIEGGEETVTQSTPLLADEVGYIVGVLSMKEKTCRDAMVEIDKVFMIEDKAVFTMQLMEEIVERGHSRIPVYHGKRSLIIGMFLTKQLICVNPKEEISLNNLELAEIPHVTSEMPLFKLLKQLKSGKSQMAIVLDAMDNLTPIGIITLENVIENLIGDEIYDETDFKKKRQQLELETKNKININNHNNSYSDINLPTSPRTEHIRSFFSHTPSNASLSLNRRDGNTGNTEFSISCAYPKDKDFNESSALLGHNVPIKGATARTTGGHIVPPPNLNSHQPNHPHHPSIQVSNTQTWPLHQPKQKLPPQEGDDTPSKKVQKKN